MTAYPVTRDMLGIAGSLPQYTSPGSYTILYAVTGTNTWLCAKCATAAHHAGMALVHGSFDEGPAVECEGSSLYDLDLDCDTEIASSYGDPDADDADDDNAPDSSDPPDRDGP